MPPLHTINQVNAAQVRYTTAHTASYISSSFLRKLGYPRTSCQRLLVGVPTFDGSTWNTSFPFQPSPDLAVEIEFGEEWLEFCHAIKCSGAIVFHPDLMEAQWRIYDVNADQENPEHLKGTATQSASVNVNIENEQFLQLSNDQKTLVLDYLVNKKEMPIVELRKLACFHHPRIQTRENNMYLKAAIQRMAFRAHACTEICLVSIEHAKEAGFEGQVLPPTMLNASTTILNLKSKTSTSTLMHGKRKAKSQPLNTPLTKRPCQPIDSQTSPSPVYNSADSEEWPCILSPSEVKDILTEYYDAMSNSILKHIECSFCGINEWYTHVKQIPINELDISLLERAVKDLQETTGQSQIQAVKMSTTKDGKYVLCRTCQQEVCRGRFKQIPIRSYANGLWLGEVPEQLHNLTLLEQQCIARVRSTKCVFKIQVGPTGQSVSRGNVCIFAQNPGPLATIMPPPLHELLQEVCVILVASPNVIVTEEMLAKTDLLVRKPVLIKALQWLHKNNSEWADIDMHMVYHNVEAYPVHGCPIPVQSVLRTSSTSSEGVSYTGHDMQSIEDIFYNEDMSNSVTSSTVVDVADIEATLKNRKLDALQKLKSGTASFLKFPAGNVPLRTSKNPSIYTQMWPILFPYGIGMPDDQTVRKNDEIGYRAIDLSTHITHLLNLADRRFQTNTTFIYVMANILQRRKTSFWSKLAVKKSWFPNVQYLMDKIDEASLKSYREKFAVDNFAKPVSEGEIAISKILRHVQYIAEHVPGSLGEVHTRREEMRGLMRVEGIPHIFFTLNPADMHNPIFQVFAGRNVSLDTIYDQIETTGSKEGAMRAKTVAQNPVSTAQAFDFLVKKFIGILLGVDRKDKKGLFGEVKSYYGIVEAQGRGSLHIHMLIWLKNGLSPIEIKDRVIANPAWGQKLLDWYDSIISQSLPEGTTPYLARPNDPPKKPVMSRFLNPRNPSFEIQAQQDLRNVLENCAQIHSHNATCFKHLPYKLKAYRDDDKDCRFKLPRKEVSKTHFDDDGDIVMKCLHGNVNGYNKYITLVSRCNTDIKSVGSGRSALSFSEYFANYTIKPQMDNSMAFTCICAAIKALEENPPMDIDGQRDRLEASRLMLIKSANQMVGKREMSGQQIASYLLGIDTKYCNEEFTRVWWSSVLHDMAPGIFEHAAEISANKQGDPLDNGPLSQEPHQMPIDPGERDTLVFLRNKHDFSNDDEPLENDKCGLFNDIFFRNEALENLCMWDILSWYKKDNLPKSKTQRKEYLKFQPQHKHHLSHCLKKRDRPVIPVLLGRAIPRENKDEDMEQYAASMMTLFLPWGKIYDSPLKNNNETWLEAYDRKKSAIKTNHQIIQKNMQLLHEAHEAKFDFSSQRRERLRQLNMQVQKMPSQQLEDNDPIFDKAMNTNAEQHDLEFEHVENEVGNYGKRVGFYSTKLLLESDIKNRFKNMTSEATSEDIERADQFLIHLMSYKQMVMNKRIATPQTMANNHHYQGQRQEGPHPFVTNLHEEYQKVRLKYEKAHGQTWNELRHYQQLCHILIEKYHLNDAQKLTFLLMADKIGRDHENGTKSEGMRLLCTGPGGTGKSVIFAAWRDFHHELGIESSLRLTAPTGVVASDIGGSTIHSEASLCVKPQQMESDRGGCRTNLEKRLEQVQTLIVDEVYFMSPKVIGILDTHLKMAKGVSTYAFANINIIFCGDPCQLAPPKQKTLFDRELVRCHESNSLNALNLSVRMEGEGITAWRSVDKVIVMTEIMRQKGDAKLTDILSRLRMGTCTYGDKNILDSYVLTNANCLDETRALTDVRKWITEPTKACPLIVYQNDARDKHNIEVARAFAEVTGQEFHLYYSKDSRGRGKGKTQLTGIAAEAAWHVPVKKADDLGGRVPFIPGMPVFGTENIAIEIGISRGCRGTLVSVKFQTIDGKRYPISAEVDFPGYTSPDPQAIHPNRVLLKPTSGSFEFKIPNSSKVYSATRVQLPLIPAFAFTSHNAQGRTLDVACIDLASCKCIQSAYVMLSRVKNMQGLCILRPFDFRRINNHISQELRAELQRTATSAKSTEIYANKTLAWYYDKAVDNQH